MLRKTVTAVRCDFKDCGRTSPVVAEELPDGWCTWKIVETTYTSRVHLCPGHVMGSELRLRGSS